MKKRILKAIHRQLCNLRQRSERKVEARKIESENSRITRQLKRHHQNWEKIMHGLSVRDHETEKPKQFDRFDCISWGVSK